MICLDKNLIRWVNTRVWRSALATVVCSWALLASAAEFDNDFEEKPWEEVAVQLPAFPAEEDWIEYRVGSLRDKKYFIDEKNLSLGSDGVIRYTLLIRTDQGAKNISYEGIRCATSERRTYAFGRSDKTWSKARNNQWVRISGSSNNHHVDFFTNLFCRNGAISFRDDEDIRRALRSGTPTLWQQ